MSFLGVLALIFIVLKLIGIISWSWWLVLLPVWGPITIYVIVTFIILTFGSRGR